MTPYVYQVLTIVAQGREAGATVIELGLKLKHDQKSLYHFVKVLTDLQLVVKFRAYQHKAWTNRVVHRRYLATSEWYKNSIKKDLDQRIPPNSQIPSLDEYGEGHSDQFSPFSLFSHVTDNLTMDHVTSLENTDPNLPVMSPINREHLAVNGNLIKSRIFTVLKRSANNTMVHADIIKAIGVANPTKDERRRLNRIMDAYIKRGFVERVAIVNKSGHTPCIRLTPVGEKSMSADSTTFVPTKKESAGQELDEELSTLPLTRSVGQTIFDLVEKSGQEGMIYKDLCYKLNDIEVRTTEQILTRMEREQAPSHLSNFKVSSILESSGREKRVRWFSTQSLKAKCQDSGIQLPPDGCSALPAKAGGFMELDASTINQKFYENAAQLYGMMVTEPKGNWGRHSKKSSRTQTTKRAGKRPQSQTAANTSALIEPVDVPPGPQDEHLIPTNNVNDACVQDLCVGADYQHTELPRKRAKLNHQPSESITTSEAVIPDPVQPPHSHSHIDPSASSEDPKNLPSYVSSSRSESDMPEAPTQKPLAVITPISPSKIRGVRHNLTSLRREHHLLEAIKFAGGIVEKTNELAKAVRDLVERADQDHVVSLMDTRTLNCALHGLELSGEIKLTSVLVSDALGSSCHRKIIYLSSIVLDGPEMTRWLEGLKVRFKTLDKASESRVNQHKDFASPAHRLSQKPTVTQPHLPNGLGVDDEALHAAFSSQWRCLSQLYGFVLGKVARAKILHLHLLKTFQQSSHSSAFVLIIDSGHRIFSSAFLFQALPISVFARLVPIMARSEEFEQFRADPGAMETPMAQAPLAIRRLLQIGNQFSRVKVYQIVEVLYHLKLVIPLRKCSEVTEYYRIAQNGEASYYSPCPMCTSVGLFCLTNLGAVYEFRKKPPNPPSLLAKWPLPDEPHGQRLWQELKRASIPDPESPPLRTVALSTEDTFQGPPKILQMLTDQSKWRDGIQLTPTQREYIVRFDRRIAALSQDLESDHDQISRIAHVLVTVPEAVKQAIRTSREARALSESRKVRKTATARKRRQKPVPAVDEEQLKSAQEEAARVISSKAKNALKQKEVDWNSIVQRFKTQAGLSEIDEEVLSDLHTLFITNSRGINANQLEAELAAWLERQKAAEQIAPVEVDAGVELLTEIESSLGSSKWDLLPMLPSAKAKRIKMLQASSKPSKLKTKKINQPRVLPHKPKQISAVAALAIRPQPNAAIGVRPAQCITKPGRRIRVDWNETLDEFLRDMVAIMRARSFATCSHVLPWPIALQVFKGVRTHVLRNRYVKLERDPKEKKYLDLLTEAWSQIYFDQRGKVPELADPMPKVPAHFDGGLALDYLRSNIDKDFLRSQLNIMDKDSSKTLENTLPFTCAELSSKYRIKRVLHPRRSQRWDEMDSNLNSTVREMNITSEALSATSKLISTKAPPSPPEVLRACEAIKLLTSTPVKTYSEPVAVAVLSHYPDELLTRATTFLCRKGVIAIGGKLHHKKRLPGRSYCYTEKYLSHPETRALQESRDTSLARLRTCSTPHLNAGVTWSALASDNDTAALLHAYSRGEVSFQIDLSANRDKRWGSSNFYRTRKLQDDSIENAVKVRFTESIPAVLSPPAINIQPTSTQLHLVHDTVLHAGAKGITPPNLTELLLSQISREIVGVCVQTLTKTHPAKLYWACNEECPILFATEYLPSWSEKVFCQSVGDPDQDGNVNTRLVEGPRIVPRLWYDLSGKLVGNLHKLSMNRVEHLIHVFPGIHYMELQRRLKLNLNPLEVDDILEELICWGKVIKLEYGADERVESKNQIVRRPWIRGFNWEDHFWTAT